MPLFPARLCLDSLHLLTVGRSGASQASAGNQHLPILRVYSVQSQHCGEYVVYWLCQVLSVLWKRTIHCLTNNQRNWCLGRFRQHCVSCWNIPLDIKNLHSIIVNTGDFVQINLEKAHWAMVDQETMAAVTVYQDKHRFLVLPEASKLLTTGHFDPNFLVFFWRLWQPPMCSVLLCCRLLQIIPDFVWSHHHSFLSGNSGWCQLNWHSCHSRPSSCSLLVSAWYLYV